MNIGIIEPYSNGFLEVLPEGESSDYWQIAAIHLNGQAYCPTPQLYRSEKAALAKAAKIYDWLAENESEINNGALYCSPLQLIVWQQSKVNSQLTVDSCHVFSLISSASPVPSPSTHLHWGRKSQNTGYHGN